MTPLSVVMWALAALVVVVCACIAIVAIRSLFVPRKSDSKHIMGGRRDG